MNRPLLVAPTTTPMVSGIKSIPDWLALAPPTSWKNSGMNTTPPMNAIDQTNDAALATRTTGFDPPDSARRFREQWATLGRTYDLDGIYFVSSEGFSDETQIANVLRPIHEYLEQNQPGTLLLVGFPNETST